MELCSPLELSLEAYLLRKEAGSPTYYFSVPLLLCFSCDKRSFINCSIGVGPWIASGSVYNVVVAPSTSTRRGAFTPESDEFTYDLNVKGSAAVCPF